MRAIVTARARSRKHSPRDAVRLRAMIANGHVLRHADACETTLNPRFKWGHFGILRASRCEADLHARIPLHPRGRH